MHARKAKQKHVDALLSALREEHVRKELTGHRLVRSHKHHEMIEKASHGMTS
jgi:hypothetical protein